MQAGILRQIKDSLSVSATQQLLQFPWQRLEQCGRKGRVGVRGKSKEERRGRVCVCVGVCGLVLEAAEGEAAAGVVRQRIQRTPFISLSG